MFVKKYYQFQCSVNALENRKDYWWEDPYDEYEKNNYGYVKGREDFIETLKTEICDATFSYFSGLKSKEETLRPVCEKIADRDTAQWLYEHLFDLVLGFYKEKEFDWQEEKCDYKKVKTEAEIEKAAEDFIRKVNAVEPEDIDYARKLTYRSEKRQNYYNYYEELLHKAILRCVSHIFKEIPELNANRIRYINYLTYREMQSFHFDLFEVIAKYIVPPIDE